MTTYATLIASNIDWLMARAKTNPNDLAATLARESPKGKAVSQATIFRIVSGESKDPKAVSIQPIADHFHVSVQQLREHDFRTNGMPPRETVAHQPFADLPPVVERILTKAMVALNLGVPDEILEKASDVFDLLSDVQKAKPVASPSIEGYAESTISESVSKGSGAMQDAIKAHTTEGQKDHERPTGTGRKR